MSQDHSPRLATILMVEEALKTAGQAISVAELKRRLPKQVNHTTLKAILAYLEQSGRITVSLQGVCWKG